MIDIQRENENIKMAIEIARRVAERGGRAYYVGGFVRDLLMGEADGNAAVSKDVDIEVHGIAPEELEAVLGELGEVKKMGVSFGVFSLRRYDIDIAMPRMEHATGRGHKDFEVFVDPFIGPENAARRRDFTVNAMMQDVLSGEVLDFFGGRKDLAGGVLRHVDDGSFAEDPLRVFRAAQFAARFGFTVAEETLRLCSRMDVTALSPERVYGETEKAFLKAGRPFDYFFWLRMMDRLGEWFPEIEAAFLENGALEPDVRPVTAAVKAAKKVSESSSDAMGFVSAAMSAYFSDFGRAAWLRRISGNKKLIRYAENTAEAALKLVNFVERGGGCEGEEELLMIFDGADRPEDALKLAEVLAEAQGKALTEKCAAAFDVYRSRIAMPAVTGQDLMDRGIAPGPKLGEAVKYGEYLRLMGYNKEEALGMVLRVCDGGDKDG